MVLEAVAFGLLAELHSERHILGGDVGLAPMEHDHAVDEEREQQVDGDAGHHDDEALPCGLCPELPWLRVALELFGIHALVHHAGNLAVAAEGQPADAVGGLTVLGLELEEVEPWVEEEIELLHSHAEELCREHVTHFVEQHQQGDCHHELERLDEKNFHVLFL